MKWIAIALAVAAVLASGLFILKGYSQEGKQAPASAPAGFKDGTYSIEGRQVTLTDGVSKVEAAPGSASKIVTRYFGNELVTDLNGDGREDIVFLVTQEQGGSGTFFYVVAALATDQGHIGSDGYLLGDRIAPQTIEASRTPGQVGVIVANYAVRAPSDPMTAAPSLGKSAYLKLDPSTMQWGVVAPDFEGEAR